MQPLRIGTLGAARITPGALVKPAADLPGVEVVAVAARDRTRAERFAAKHAIPTVHDSYDALIADPRVEAVYNPLPNGLHGRWTIAALEAGKHVLCEKPFTADAAEAEEVAGVAGSRRDLVVMEAFHYRYHPLVERVREIVASGELGTIERLETRMCFPLPRFNDIRYQLDLAGGALMDAGCYAIHQLRTLADAEPEVVSAEAKCAKPQVDRWTRAELRFADGRTAGIECSMWSRRLLSLGARVVGTGGELRVLNLTGPQYYHRMAVRTRAEGSASRTRRTEKVKGKSTYWYQLQAFTKAVRESGAVLTPPADSIANMRVIDDVYRAAGLEPRRPTP